VTHTYDMASHYIMNTCVINTYAMASRSMTNTCVITLVIVSCSSMNASVIAEVTAGRYVINTDTAVIHTGCMRNTCAMPSRYILYSIRRRMNISRHIMNTCVQYGA